MSQHNNEHNPNRERILNTSLPNLIEKVKPPIKSY
jgi:hypothetical protein